jgi:hypothetical protein
MTLTAIALIALVTAGLAGSAMHQPQAERVAVRARR